MDADKAKHPEAGGFASAMDTDIVIRPARPGDIPGMCGLLADLFAIEADFVPDRTKQAQALSILTADRSGSSLTLVAAAGGKVIGMCSVQMVISTAEGGSAGVVEDLVVHRVYRGQGIATRMLDVLLKWCRAQGITRLQLLADKDNDQAHAFYFARGWSCTNLVCLRKHL